MPRKQLPSRRYPSRIEPKPATGLGRFIPEITPTQRKKLLDAILIIQTLMFTNELAEYVKARRRVAK